MPIVRLLSLDCSTWGALARLYPSDASARKVLGSLQEGAWLPFLTLHHLEELFGHENDETVEQRADLLRSLKLVCYFPSHNGVSPVGDIVTLQIREIQTALKDPNATTQEVVDQTTCLVTSSFASGQELLEKGRAFFNAWRSVNPEKMRRRAMVAGLTHFESTDRERKLPGPSEMVCIRSPDDAQPRLNTLEAFLKDKMCRSGDKRLDVEEAMSQFATLLQAARNNFPPEPGSISFAQLLSSFDVAYSDLPAKPTLGDFLDEIEFQSQCRALEEAAGWSPKALRGRIKQNQVPSRVIIREIQRASRNQGRAFASNFNDNYIAAFSPYVQRLEVDKRTLHFAERAARRSGFLSAMRAKMFRKSDLSVLAQELEQANP